MATPSKDSVVTSEQEQGQSQTGAVLDAPFKLKYSARALVLAAFCAPLLPVFLLKSLAPIFIMSAIIFPILCMVENRRFYVPINKSFAVFFAVFLVYIGLSYFWSINPEATLDKYKKMLLFFVPLSIFFGVVQEFKKQHCELMLKGLVWGLVVAVILYIIEGKFDFQLFQIFHDADVEQYDAIQNRTLFLFFLFVGPALLYCWHKKDRKQYLLAGIFLVSYIPSVIWMSGNASMQNISILFTLAVVVAFWLPSSFLKPLILTAMVITCLGAPQVAQYLRGSDGILDTSISNSLKSRIEIWDFTARSIPDHPILGAGLKSAAHMPHKGEVSAIYDEPTRITHLHPHNGVLEIWYELGAVGIAFLLGLLYLIMRSIDKMQDEMIKRWLILSFALGFLYILPSFGLWQTRFMAMLALFTFYLICVTKIYECREAEKEVTPNTAPQA
jgi:O-antigen ligase